MKLSIIFIALLIPVLSFSQEKLPTSVSTPYYAIQAEEKYYLSDTEKGKVLTIKIVKGEVCMLLFDSKTNKHIKKNIINDVQNGFLIKNIKKIGCKYYCFMDFWDAKNQLEQLFVREIDFDSCCFKGTDKKIIEIKHSIEGDFSLGYSRDSSKMLIHAIRKIQGELLKDSYGQYCIYVFDEKMDLLNSGEISMPYPQKNVALLDQVINSENVPCFLFLVNNPKYSEANKTTTPTYSFELFHFNLANKSIHITRINHEEDKFIKTIQLRERADNKISCIGLYSRSINNSNWAATLFSNAPSQTLTQGFFVIDIDKKSELVDKKYYPYNIDGEEISLVNLNIRAIKIFDDNSIRIITEEASYEESYYGNGNRKVTYFYKNIIIAKINTANELVWIKKIKKNQTGPYAFRCGYGYVFIGNKHYFTFFDNPRNEIKTAAEYPQQYDTKEHEAGYLAVYCLDDETSLITKYTAINAKVSKDDYKIYGIERNSATPISTSEFVIELTQKKALEMMVKIKVQ